MSSPLSEQIAILALDTFSKLPLKCKPRILPDGRREWTTMSAIILNQPGDLHDVDSDAILDNVKIVSLATGTKSLPVSALSKCKGLILHDCHAEILALRGFNYWLLAEIRRMLKSDSYRSLWLEFTSSECMEREYTQTKSSFPFRLRAGVEISLFSTEAPCGDASMELLMSAAEAAGRDITPWPTTRAAQDGSIPQVPPGRGCFSDLGALRRKPARADAEISMSKSCTDKLMLKQFTGLIAFPANLFVEPSREIFLKRVVTYEDCWNQKGYTRAFSAHGRLRELLPTIQHGVMRHPTFFEVDTLSRAFTRFEFEKDAASQNGQKSRTSNVSALWIAGAEGEQGTIEVLLNGVKQGFRQFDDREHKGSVVCRRKMLQEGFEIAGLLKERSDGSDYFSATTENATVRYSILKSQPGRSGTALRTQKVLDGLGGWPQKEYEDDFDVQMASSTS